MPKAHNGDVELHYETIGDPDGVPLLLVMGLGAQLITWDEELCESFADRGFRVIRHDNRDMGLSTWFDDHPIDAPAVIGAVLAGESVTPPYTMLDMAEDAAAVLDAAGVSSAHVIGASMGGMIAQTLAVHHPDRVRSLVSVMSTTGDPDVGQPHPEVAGALLEAVPPGREAAIARAVEVSRVIGSPIHFDEEAVRALCEREYDRGHHPDGVLRQLFAILVQEPRTEALRSFTKPALVVHGELDRLVDPSGGRRTAEALPGAELVMLPDAAHDLPRIYWPQLIERVTALAAEADRADGAVA
jgi:pimeloyl-ACP methyl ester carboxylesterase